MRPRSRPTRWIDATTLALNMANAYKALLNAVELLALGAKQFFGLGERGLARQVELAQHFDAHCAMVKEFAVDGSIQGG